MSQPFTGEIRIFSFSFAPRGWAFCDGATMAISQNTALYALLGTTYGGDGRTTFMLPNLQGCAAMHWGSGTGLTSRTLGEKAGSDTETLLTANLPQHSHTLNGSTVSSPTQLATTPSATATFGESNPDAAYATTLSPAVPFSPKAIGITGGSQPHANAQPRLALNFCVAIQGVFPTRN